MIGKCRIFSLNGSRLISRSEGPRRNRGFLLWNLSIGDRKVQDLQFKSVYSMIAKDPKPGNLNEVLGGLESDQDSRLQRPLSYH